jgi:type I restriction enzyme S subunit
VSHRVRDTVHEAVFASYLIRFNVLEGIEPRFIEFFLKSHEYWQTISDFTAGIAIPNVNATKLASLELPLAPLNEQHRIVAKLEKLLGKVASQQRLAKIPIILKRFRQAVLAAACSGRLTTDWRQEHPDSEPDNGGREFDLPGSWKFIEFGQLISDGPQNGLYKPAEFYGEGTLIVRIDAFYDGTFAPWGTLKRIRLTEKEQTQFSVRNGDILINRVNSPKFLGKAALVRKLTESCVYESNMMRLRLDCSKVQPDYAILYLQSLPGLVELRKNAKHAVNQSSINQEDVKSAQFNLPPPAEQREIVRRVEAFFKLADQIEARFVKAKASVDQLTQSLLFKAFQGELVPQDPNDEPAAVLLERIKAEREKGENEERAGGNRRKDRRKGKVQ